MSDAERPPEDDADVMAGGIAAAGLLDPRFTAVGLFLSPELPIPSSPLLLPPQHKMLPPTMTAQVWMYPAEMATAETPEPSPTVVGLLIKPPNGTLSIPSWPFELAPQHRTPPLVANAHV
jgi:hypothetical protein